MATKASLEAYHDEQANIVLSASANVVRRGHISSPADIYPDVEVIDNSSYVRSAIPLSFLLLLYDRTVIFLPPTSSEMVGQRFHLPLEKIVEFARHEIVQPIIGHVLDYSAGHFAALLQDVRPPDLWARGSSLLERLGMGEALVESKCPLPVASMARLAPIRAKYSSRFPALDPDELTQRIKTELLTAFADLCIFGERELAEKLAGVGDTQRIADRLIVANELRTYPTLFGLGGTANYDIDNLRREAQLHQTLAPMPSGSGIAVPAAMHLLLDGLGIRVSEMRAQDLVEFHQSGDGKRLRLAMSDFERRARKAVGVRLSSTDLEDLLEVSAALESVVRSAVSTLSTRRFRRKIALWDKRLRMTLKIGSPAVGALLGQATGISALAGAAGGAILEAIIGETQKQGFVDTALELRFRPGLANIWRIGHRYSP